MSIYKTYSDDQLENHLSQFLVNSWSYSKVSTFSRNQKAFEMQYIYGHYSKKSATSIAGKAYHKALEHFFNCIKFGEKTPDLIELTDLSYNYIIEEPACNWKIQKTCPTVEKCIEKASQIARNLLENFLTECSLYVDQIEEVISVEQYGSEFITLNGVDIPLPLNFVCDLVIQTKDNKIVIVDHKSKSTYTSEAEIMLSNGKQAVTYVIGCEHKLGVVVDEVWFIENKYSTNKDKSPQLLKHIIDFTTKDARKYYEVLLYESVRAMIRAANDPDYVYLTNDSDNFIDLAELYEFHAKTLLAEVEDFNISEDKTELIKKRLKKIKDSNIKTLNPDVIKTFKNNASQFIQYDYSNKDMTQSEKIEHVLRGFGISSQVSKVFDGYSNNSYLLEVGIGTKISSIHSRKLDLANALDVSNVRISQNLFVWEGKSYIQVEVSKKRERSLEFNPDDLVGMKIPIGKDNMENVIYWDLNNHSTPHALVCGSTGSGKSVALKSTIEYAKKAGVEHIIVLDPKFEFCKMDLKDVEIYSEIDDIETVLSLLVDTMNERIKSGDDSKVLVIFDEFADAQAQGKKGKELDIYETKEIGFYKQSLNEQLAGLPPQPKYATVKTGQRKSLEENLRVLLKKGRSVGFRIVCATQRASTKIITGDAKANFPVLICFRLPKEIDSRVVIDEPGAESLAGMGDGLIKSPEYMETVRFQAYYSA